MARAAVHETLTAVHYVLNRCCCIMPVRISKLHFSKKLGSGPISKSRHGQLLEKVCGHATCFKASKHICLQNGPSENIILSLVFGHVHKETISTCGRIVWADLMAVIPSARVGIQRLARTAECLIAIAPNALHLLQRGWIHLPYAHKCWRNKRRERTHIPHNPRGAKLSVPM